MDQLERILFVHRVLSARRTGISFADLQSRLEDRDIRCTTSTLKRVLGYLRGSLGAPLRYDAERGGYFYDRELAHELPGLWFTAQELAALLVLEDVIEQQPLGLLSETLKPFRPRLERLAGQSGIGIPRWRSRLRLLRMAARSAGTQFGVVAQALAQGQRLRIDYHGRADDRMAARIVSPQRLILYRDNWYLDAWCHARDALRTFALDRIIAAEPLDTPADEIADGVLDQTLATSYGIFAGTPTDVAVLRFSPHAARWVAAEIWHPHQQDARDEQGRLTRRLPYHRTEELLMDILRHGADVEVLEPTPLRHEIARRLRHALAQYDDAAPAAERGRHLNNSGQRLDSAPQYRAASAGSVHEPEAAYARPRTPAARPRR